MNRGVIVLLMALLSAGCNQVEPVDPEQKRQVKLWYALNQDQYKFIRRIPEDVTPQGLERGRGEYEKLRKTPRGSLKAFDKEWNKEMGEAEARLNDIIQQTEGLQESLQRAEQWWETFNPRTIEIDYKRSTIAGVIQSIVSQSDPASLRLHVGGIRHAEIPKIWKKESTWEELSTLLDTHIEQLRQYKPKDFDVPIADKAEIAAKFTEFGFDAKSITKVQKLIAENETSQSRTVAEIRAILSSMEPEVTLETSLADHERPKIILRPDAHHANEVLDGLLMAALMQKGDVALNEGSNAGFSYLSPIMLSNLVTMKENKWSFTFAQRLLRNEVPIHFNGTEDMTLHREMMDANVAYASAMPIYAELMRKGTFIKAAPEVFKKFALLQSAYHNPRELAMAHAYVTNHHKRPQSTVLGVIGQYHTRKGCAFMTYLEQQEIPYAIIRGKVLPEKKESGDKGQSEHISIIFSEWKVRHKGDARLALDLFYRTLKK